MSRSKTPEGQAKAAVRDLFRTYGWRVINFWGGPMSEPGIPDLMVVSKAGLYPYTVHLWIEMKRPASRQNPRGHVRKQQKLFIADILSRGGLAIICDGVDENLIEVAAGRGGLEGLSALIAAAPSVTNL